MMPDALVFPFSPKGIYSMEISSSDMPGSKENSIAIEWRFIDHRARSICQTQLDAVVVTAEKQEIEYSKCSGQHYSRFLPAMFRLYRLWGKQGSERDRFESVMVPIR